MMCSSTLSDNSSSRQLDLSIFGAVQFILKATRTGLMSLLSLTRSNAVFIALLAGFKFFHQKFRIAYIPGGVQFFLFLVFFLEGFFCNVEFLYISNLLL